MRQVGSRRFVEGGGGHEHARRAVAALKGLRVQERALQRVQFAVAGEPFDRGHRVSAGAKGGHEAAMQWRAVDPNGARTAISRVAAFLDAEPAQLTQERTQALPGARLC